MTLLLAVVTAQLADLAAYVAAIVRFPSGEANPLQSGSPRDVVITKAVGIAVLVLGLGAVGRWRLPLAALFIVVGAVGAASAVINGGLL